jgi:hypothetical protein
MDMLNVKDVKKERLLVINIYNKYIERKNKEEGLWWKGKIKRIGNNEIK